MNEIQKKRGKAPKGKGTVKGAVKFAMNPTGAAVKAVAGKAVGAIKAKRAGKAGGGMANKTRKMYKHGGKHNDRIMYAGGGDVLKPN